jgi:hypothetical protein
MERPRQLIEVMTTALATGDKPTAVARPAEGAAILPATLVALVLFLLVRGPASLDPGNIGWLDLGDRAMHTLGWFFYRLSPWGWPPGASQYGLELGNSIALVDGLPLFAIPLKALSPWLPEIFQYWGWWHLTSFVLQAVFAVLIAYHLGLSRILQLAAAIFCLIQPAFLARLDVHLALSGHWVILAAIYLYVRKPAPPRWAWPLLLAAVSAIHGYLLVMVFALWFAALVQRIWLKSVPTGRLVVEAALAIAAIFATLWACGVLMAGSYESFGFGRWRMNLLGPFNADFWSLTLPSVPIDPDEWEGANFVGIGIGVLMLIALLSVSRVARLFTASWAPIALVTLAMAIFALSNRVAFGSIELFTIPLPDWLMRFLTTFRSSGRFFWPFGYLIIFAVLVIAAHRFRPAWATAIVLVLALVQIYDEQRGWRGMYITPARTAGYDTFRTYLDSPAWDALAPHYARVRALPIQNNTPLWRDLSWFAFRNHLQTATVSLGRIDPRVEARERARGEDIVRTGDYDEGAIYTLGQDEAQATLAHLRPGDAFGRVDGAILFARNGKQWLDAAGVSLEPFIDGRGIKPGYVFEKP